MDKDKDKYKLQCFKKASEDKGTLKLFKYGRLVPGAKWTVRSGQPGAAGYWNRGLSPIPPSKAIKGSYEVKLPGFPPGYRNSMGDWCYHIIPDPILEKNGSGIRSEVCIHSDANVTVSPGSAGCIVLHPDIWGGFRKVMDAIHRQEGDCVIPLEVIYE